MQIGVITNPNSRKNKGKPDRAQRLQSIVGELGEVHETRTLDSIKPVLRDFLRKRARYWVADGGDGALHWMLRMGMEVMQEDEFAGRAIAMPLTMPTNGGTIDFIAGNVGIKGDAEGLLATLRGKLERGQWVEETEVDSMVIEGIEATADGDRPFRTWGFAVAAGGIGQRFFAKYYEADDPNPRTIVKVVTRALLSMPVAMTPLGKVPALAPFGDYARSMFKPTRAKVTLDGMVLPGDQFTGIHVASMSINLGNVLKFFGKADQPGPDERHRRHAVAVGDRAQPAAHGARRRDGRPRGPRSAVPRAGPRGGRRRAPRAGDRRRVLPQPAPGLVPARPAGPHPEGRQHVQQGRPVVTTAPRGTLARLRWVSV
jgi:hypothetical protein